MRVARSLSPPLEQPTTASMPLDDTDAAHKRTNTAPNTNTALHNTVRATVHNTSLMAMRHGQEPTMFPLLWFTASALILLTAPCVYEFLW